MAFSDVCKIEFGQYVKNELSRGKTKKDIIEQFAKDANISKETIKNWLYPKRQKAYNKKRKSVVNDTRSKPDGKRFTANLDGFNDWLKETGECLIFAHKIIRGKVSRGTSEKERKVVISCFKLINAFYKKHKGEKLFENGK